MKQFNKGPLLQAVRRSLDVLGDYSAQLEESVGLVLPLVSSLQDTAAGAKNPDGWALTGSRAKAAVALQASCAFVRPAVNKVLRVVGIEIVNANAGIQTVEVRFQTDAQLAAVAAAGTAINMIGLTQNSSGDIATARTVTASQQGTTGAALASFNLTMAKIAEIQVPIGGSASWFGTSSKHPGIYLYGDDPNGANLIVVDKAVQQTLQVNWLCHEYELPRG